MAAPKGVVFDARRLRARMKAKGFHTNQALADAVDLTMDESTIRRALHGEGIRRDRAEAIAKALEEDLENLEPRCRWVIVFGERIDHDFMRDAQALYDLLKDLSGDDSLRLAAVERGSIRLTLEGTEEGFLRIRELYESGRLAVEVWERLELELESPPAYLGPVEDTPADSLTRRTRAFLSGAGRGLVERLAEQFGAPLKAELETLIEGLGGRGEMPLPVGPQRGEASPDRLAEAIYATTRALLAAGAEDAGDLADLARNEARRQARLVGLDEAAAEAFASRFATLLRPEDWPAQAPDGD